jgi:hypothetical protein
MPGTSDRMLRRRRMKYFKAAMVMDREKDRARIYRILV